MPTNRLIVKEQIATYTELLFTAAKNEGDAEYVLSVCGQAKGMAQAIRGNADFDSALKDPGYTPEQKAQLIKGVFSDAEPVLVNTVAVMAERGEIEYLPRVTAILEDRIADELNLIIVDVDTAVELDDHLRDLIKKKAETELGKKAVLHERVDKSLLGGIILSTKDERLDASLVMQVEKTREALKH